MPKSKVNQSIFERLVANRTRAMRFAGVFGEPAAFPIYETLYQQAAYPDARLKDVVARDIISWEEEIWRKALAPDEEGRIANLFLVEYECGQNPGGTSMGSYFPIRAGQVPDKVDIYDRKRISQATAGDIGAFVMYPLDAFITALRADFDPFEDTKVFWAFARFMVATSHVIAHMAFAELEERGAFRNRGLVSPSWFGTIDHGESYADIIYVLG